MLSRLACSAGIGTCCWIASWQVGRELVLLGAEEWAHKYKGQKWSFRVRGDGWKYVNKCSGCTNGSTK